MNEKQSVSLLLLIVVILGLLSVSMPVQAKTLDVTSSPTVYHTMTVEPIGTFTTGCSVGLPVGYGTVTPGAVWQAMCGQCIPTTTAMPTVSWLLPTNTP